MPELQFPKYSNAQFEQDSFIVIMIGLRLTFGFQVDI